MGKKKQQHQTQSFSNMVSRAALEQLMPSIEQMVAFKIRQLGSQLAMQQAQTVEKIYTRIITLERLLIDAKVTSQDDLINRLTNLEDEAAGLVQVDDLQVGDTARISVRVQQPNETAFPESTSRLKCSNIGPGDNLGKDVEEAIIGMKVGEVRVVNAGDKGAKVEITLTRSSRAPKVEEPKKEEPTNGDQVQEQ